MSEKEDKIEFPLNVWYVAALAKEITNKPLARTLLNNPIVKTALKILSFTPAGMVLKAVGQGAELAGGIIGGRNNIQATPSVNSRQQSIVNKNNIQVTVPDGTTPAQAATIVSEGIIAASKFQSGYNFALESTSGME